jgi:hypothetical protein
MLLYDNNDDRCMGEDHLGMFSRSNTKPEAKRCDNSIRTPHVNIVPQRILPWITLSFSIHGHRLQRRYVIGSDYDELMMTTKLSTQTTTCEEGGRSKVVCCEAWVRKSGGEEIRDAFPRVFPEITINSIRRRCTLQAPSRLERLARWKSAVFPSSTAGRARRAGQRLIDDSPPLHANEPYIA